MNTQVEAELILRGTAKRAGGHVGWLTPLGSGVNCCEREEGAESEEKGLHLLGRREESKH